MAAQSAVVIFRGQSGRRYNVAAYLNDTANDLVRFDGGQGASATSPQYWTVPENGAVIDVILAAATAQTKTQMTRNNKSTGDTLLNAVYLASIAFRPPLAIPYAKGETVGGIQIA